MVALCYYAYASIYAVRYRSKIAASKGDIRRLQDCFDTEFFLRSESEVNSRARLDIATNDNIAITVSVRGAPDVKNELKCSRRIYLKMIMHD